MGIIAVRLHNMGGNPELVDGVRRGLTFKKTIWREGPLPRGDLETSLAALMILIHLNPSSPSMSHTCIPNTPVPT